MKQTTTTPLSRPIVALTAAVILAIVHQYLFYGNTPGVSYPIFVILFYVFMFHDDRDNVRRSDLFGWFLLAVIVLLSMTFVLFNNLVLYGLNLVVIPPLIFLHLAYLRSERKLMWWDIRIIGDAISHLIPQSLRHMPMAYIIVKNSTVRRLGEQQKSVMAKILIGLVISIPLIIVVINLLASADGVFNRVLMTFPEWWSGLSLSEGLTRFLWINLFTLLFFGYLWGFVDTRGTSAKRQMEEEAGGAAAKARESLTELALESELDSILGRSRFTIDPIILGTLLISVNLVYVLFVTVQFTYLFGAWEGVLPDGKSYAEYARSGFVELVTVTSLNFIILMVTLAFGGQDGGKLKKLNANLLFTLIGCSGVMLYSAYTRLILYEEAYGYTYIRFMVHAFMIFLALLLVVAALRIRSTAIPLAQCYIVISLCAYVFINYVGMDTLIAQKNIERFRESGTIDEAYLQSLSTDAIPTLIKFSKEEHPAMKPYLEQKWMTLSQIDRRWPSFNLSHYRATKDLSDYLAGEQNP